MIKCKHHGLQPFYIIKDKQSKNGIRKRCKKCISEAVTRRIQKAKRILVEEAGGKCKLCGYDRCMRNLHFHHIDPSQKEFQISGGSRSLTRLRAEVNKCKLLCSNCHGEVEEGLLAL